MTAGLCESLSSTTVHALIPSHWPTHSLAQSPCNVHCIASCFSLQLLA